MLSVTTGVFPTTREALVCQGSNLADTTSFSECDYSKTIPKRRVLFGMQWLGIVVAYVLRVCVSTAAQKVSQDSIDQTMYTEFHWTSAQQSAMLGAFFYGYTVMQIPGSWLTAKFGPTRVFGYGLLCASTLTLLTPAVSSSFLACITLRVTTGLVEGATYPAMTQQVRNWTPVSERSSVLSFIMAGAFIGTAIGVPFSSTLLTSFGWRSIFYVTGSLGCLWSLGWFFLAADTPTAHGRVHPHELSLIGEPPCVRTSLTLWQTVRLLRHQGVRAFCAAGFAYCWAYYLVMTELPSYLATVLGFSLAKSGLLGVLPFVSIAATANAGGIALDWAKRHNMDMRSARRVCFTTAAVGACACLVGAAHAHTASMAFAFIVVATGFVGLSVPGYAPNVMEIGGSQASSVWALMNTVSSISGFVAPQLAGVLTAALGDGVSFRLLFWISGGIYMVAACIWVSGISLEEIPEGVPENPELSRGLLITHSWSFLQFQSVLSPKYRPKRRSHQDRFCLLEA